MYFASYVYTKAAFDISPKAKLRYRKQFVINIKGWSVDAASVPGKKEMLPCARPQWTHYLNNSNFQNETRKSLGQVNGPEKINTWYVRISWKNIPKKDLRRKRNFI